MDDALAFDAASVDHFERLQMVRSPVVGHVQRALVRRKADAVGLVERVGDADYTARPWVVSPHGVPKEWLRPEALEPPVARVREPDRAVALDDYVVGRVEARHDRGPRATSPVYCDDRPADLLAHDQTAVVAE